MLKEEIKNIKTDKIILRKFGLLLTVFIGIFGAISLWKGSGTYEVLFPVAGVVLLLALIVPMALKVIYVPWMAVATVIGWVVTRLILTVLYYGVMTPFGLVGRLFRKDFLDEKLDPDKASYWTPREQRSATKVDFERQF